MEEKWRVLVSACVNEWVCVSVHACVWVCARSWKREKERWTWMSVCVRGWWKTVSECVFSLVRKREKFGWVRVRPMWDCVWVCLYLCASVRYWDKDCARVRLMWGCVCVCLTIVVRAFVHVTERETFERERVYVCVCLYGRLLYCDKGRAGERD